MNASSSPDDRHKIENGEKLLKQGDPHSALRNLTYLASMRPITLDVATAMYLSGIAFRRIEEFNASVRNLEDALKAARHFHDREFEQTLIKELALTFSAARTHRPSS